jgi:hypothetical protein
LYEQVLGEEGDVLTVFADVLQTSNEGFVQAVGGE